MEVRKSIIRKCNVIPPPQKKAHITVSNVLASTDVKPTQITHCLRINPIPEIRLK